MLILKKIKGGKASDWISLDTEVLEPITELTKGTK